MASEHYLPPIGSDSRGDKSIRRDTTLYNIPANNVSRQYVYELEEKVRVLKDDIAKKDDLIRRLSNIEVKEIIRTASSNEPDASSVSRKTIHAEYAALQVKFDSLTAKLREKELECDMKRDAHQNAQHEIEFLKEECARHQAIVEQMTKKLESIQEGEISYETLRARSEATVKTLQQHNQESQTRIVELESRIRQLLNDREKSDHEKGSFEKRFYNLVNEVAKMLGDSKEATSDSILSRISVIVKENATLKGDLFSTKQLLAAEEKERKTSHLALDKIADEIKKLQADRDAIHQAREQSKQEVEQIRAEKALLVNSQQETQKKLADSEKSLKSLQVDHKDLEVRFLRLQEEKQFTASQTAQAEKQFQVFLEALSSFLSTAYSHCPPNESCVKERVRSLAKDLQESKETIRSMELQVKSSKKQADHFTDSLQDKTLQLKRHEVQQMETEEHRRRVESELGSLKALYDLSRGDRERILTFIQQMRSILNMGEVQGDVPLETSTKDILEKVQRLVRVQSAIHQDPLSQIHELRRRMKHLQNQCKEKDTTIGNLEEKVLRLKEKLIYAKREAGLSTDRVNETELHSEELNRLRQRVDVLLEENSELRLRMNDRSASPNEKETWELKRALDKLERVRQKQAEKIAELSDKLQEDSRRQSESRFVAENAVQSLSNELRGTRALLEASQRRENQLMDLRSIVARMLGLKVDRTVIADHEIVNQLERVIMGELTVSYPPHRSVDAAQEDHWHRRDLDRLDYDELRHGSSHDVSPNHRHSQHRPWTRVQHRPRSHSPKRPDTRQY